MKAVRNLILHATHHIWNREISRILCRAYSERIINSEQLHILAARFDPTQDHHVGRKRENDMAPDRDMSAEWQDISTAQSDNEQIWTWNAHQPKDPPKISRADGSWWRVARSQWMRHTPTHWMPVKTPEPPKSET